jgi:hypothetical protein
MPNETQSRQTTFGYLSTVRTAEHGYFGGYLIISPLGRPLEFHCTSPIRPNRAQEILFGPTLEPYLLGEQIGGTLVQAAKLTPHVVFTDQRAMLAARPQSPVPMAFLAARHREQLALVDGKQQRCAPRHCVSPADGRVDQLFSIGEYDLEVAAAFGSDRDEITQALGSTKPTWDLAEPFGRIHEAIWEAQRIGGQMLEDHDQAA